MIYERKKKAHFEAHPNCQLKIGVRGCPMHREHKATDLHHTRGRGSFYLDETTFASACRAGHAWVHANPNAARELGMLKTNFRRVS